MQKMQIVILTCIHGRHDVASLMLKHHTELAAGLRESCGWDFQLAAVMSPDDAAAMSPVCEVLGVRWWTHQNEPVSVKWQAGLAFVRESFPAADAVMIIGSDDFMSVAYMTQCASAIAYRHSLGFGPDRCWMLSAATGRLGLWRRPVDRGIHGIPCGAGRTFSRELLDCVNWRLWRGNKNTGLDTLCSNRLRKLGYSLDLMAMTDRGPRAVIDVKTADNIHGWGSIPYAEVLEPPAATFHIGELGLACCLELCNDPFAIAD